MAELGGWTAEVRMLFCKHSSGPIGKYSYLRIKEPYRTLLYRTALIGLEYFSHNCPLAATASSEVIWSSGIIVVVDCDRSAKEFRHEVNASHPKFRAG